MKKLFLTGVLLLALVVSSAFAPFAGGNPQTKYDRLIVSVPEISVLEPDGSVSNCTAFAVRAKQYLTAAHCIKDVVAVRVGEEDADVIKVDTNKDLALLMVDRMVPVLELASQEPEVGTEVTYLGYPSQFSSPLTFFGRVMGGKVKVAAFRDLLFIDGSGAQGMSGGPVLRLDNGKVVGLVRGGAAFNAQTRQDVMVYAATVKQIREFLK